ncbi:PREDICTED: endoplasmic reticulum lectin 1-like isoform X2 [Amphimedon queenslandica]|uniref:Endoplasmic reticulum lectin 1 n=1 Tax=Amphimedon queenslandica TaxID=400682 RepID=A0AAN0J3E2_AMPQE|nr:PREDICTED: endoplasmic reticulum lectin 1-like isoform X2 [Amphimedon queenslandica]XP_019851530.1 PREDICTED: endoplasmic reticulum lectin 1-like isoform X2 [Amphimedon queenslandica]|eukprot:XP_019851529.1 PREDICTED: endoplasmic reticulum lectin 1-like isoform X2 [Amphimedon queenslandica]
MVSRLVHYFFISLFLLQWSPFTGGSDYNPFDDSIKFEVTWPGCNNDFSEKKLLEEDEASASGQELLTTFDNEQYKCTIPTQLLSDKEENEISSDALLPHVLLEPILLSDDCVILVDGYWSYEMCYGKQLRQFHEERNQEELKVVEYNLGKFNKLEAAAPPNPPPTWPYLNIDYPYYEVSLSDGSPCDIKDDMGRTTKVMIICDPEHRTASSLVMVKETSTCQYEAVIATKSLCKNKAYRVKDEPVHSIQCLPVKDSPSKPLRLVQHESSMKDISFSKDTPSLFRPQSNTDMSPAQGAGAINSDSQFDRSQLPLDSTFVANFLSGSTCILGSFSSWWQYELCFKGYVRQFHKEGGIIRQTITLGTWSEEAHRQWFSKMGKGKQSANHVTHLYVSGDVCDLTGQPRQARVKFRAQFVPFLSGIQSA